MAATLHTAVHDHVDIVANRIHNFLQLVKGRAAPFQLAAPMIRYYDPGGADFFGFYRIFLAHYAL